MPGIKSLDDADFIRAFQVVDGVILRSQPLFIFVWIGSVLALVLAAVLGVWQLRGADRVFLIGASLVYVLGVQVPTITVNIPFEQRPSEAGSRHDERDPTKTRAR